MKTIKQYKSQYKNVKTHSGDIVISYTQIYDIAPLISSHLTMIASFQLLMLIIATIAPSDNNIFKSDTNLQSKFLSIFNTSQSSFKKAIKQLKDTQIIIPQQNKGYYLLNPHIAWKGSTQQRINILKNNTTLPQFNYLKL